MKNPIKFYYVRRDSNKVGKAGHCGVMTIATKVKDSMVAFGFSFCSPKDQFVKSLGRKIALGLLESHPIVTSFTGNSANDIARVWKEHNTWDYNRMKNGEKVCIIPQIWRKSLLANIIQTGLTVVNKA